MTFILASVASMGMPGFSGFVAELQVLIGAWQAFPTLAVVAGLGFWSRVAYHAPRAPKGILCGKRSRPTRTAKKCPFTASSQYRCRNACGAALLLMGISLLIGLYPRLLLDLISRASVPRYSTACERGGP